MRWKDGRCRQNNLVLVPLLFLLTILTVIFDLLDFNFINSDLTYKELPAKYASNLWHIVNKRIWHALAYEFIILAIVYTLLTPNTICVFIWEGREGWMKEDRRRNRSHDVLSQFQTQDPWHPNHGSRRCKPLRIGNGITVILWV